MFIIFARFMNKLRFYRLSIFSLLPRFSWGFELFFYKFERVQDSGSKLTSFLSLNIDNCLFNYCREGKNLQIKLYHSIIFIKILSRKISPKTSSKQALSVHFQSESLLKIQNINKLDIGEITPAPIRLKSNPNALLQNLRSPIYLRVQMNSNMLTENNLS